MTDAPPEERAVPEAAPEPEPEVRTGERPDAREDALALNRELLIELRSRKVTSGCTHARNICFSCTRRHCSEEVNTKGNVAITCPHNECNQPLSHADIQHFASVRDFRRIDDVGTRRFLQSLGDEFTLTEPLDSDAFDPELTVKCLLAFLSIGLLWAVAAPAAKKEGSVAEQRVPALSGSD